MYECELAKFEEEHSVVIDPSWTIKSVTVKYEEFPDRNAYIHGLTLTGTKEGRTENVFDQTFANYRGREESFEVPNGQDIVGL